MYQIRGISACFGGVINGEYLLVYTIGIRNKGIGNEPDIGIIISNSYHN